MEYIQYSLLPESVEYIRNIIGNKIVSTESIIIPDNVCFKTKIPETLSGNIYADLVLFITADSVGPILSDDYIYWGVPCVRDAK